MQLQPLRGLIRHLLMLATILTLVVAPSVAQAAPASEPVPAVSPQQFAIQPVGTALQDYNAKIPNLATPTGSPVAKAAACTLTFRAGPQVTSTTVNEAIKRLQNTMTKPTVVCLSGTFQGPIQVWGKYDPALLTIQTAPQGHAVLSLGSVSNRSAVNPNEYDGVAGAVSIVDSRGVEIRGLTITGYHAWGTTATPAGIYVEVRAKGFGGKPSACFVHGDHACSGIYLIDNHISYIRNLADTRDNVKHWCNNGNVDAFGIEVESFGKGIAQSLQHVVIEGNTVDHTRTGQSETVAVNGDVRDFLVAKNHIYNGDNIGIDTEGWYNGTGQSSYGIVRGNIVANIDTLNNHAYGVWDAKTQSCQALQPNAGGIYDDGGAYIWIANNVVANTDQGISLDTETAHRFTDHLLITGNRVWNSPGTSLADPSYGRNPAGIPGRSTVAGHAYDAFYVDAFGPGSRIFDVYAHNNLFQNASLYFGGTVHYQGAVVDFGGNWKNVVMWNNEIVGGGPKARNTVLVGVDNKPAMLKGTLVDCTEYKGLSPGTNFYLPGNGPSFNSFSAWQRHNGYGWDRNSAVNRSPSCPAALP
jgi:hypothetical protein